MIVCTTTDVSVATVVVGTYTLQRMSGLMFVSYPTAASALQPETKSVAITQGKFVPLQETVSLSSLLGAAGLVYMQEERGVGPDVSGVKKDTL